MSKKVYFGAEAQKGIQEGVDLIANAVKTTLGPRGRFVGIHKKYTGQHMTKDGVTVAKEIESSDLLVDFAIKTVQEASSKTANVAGDGTTSATVLTQAIYNYGQKYISAGANAVSIQRGLFKAVEVINQYLKKNAVDVKADDLDQLRRVATISANNDESIGDKVAEVISRVGKSGVVSVEEYQGTGLLVEYVEGIQLDRGYTSAYFVTDKARMECIIPDASVLIVDGKLSYMKPLVPLLEKMIEANKRQVVIVADDIEGDALSNLVVNKLQNVLNICAIKAPGFGDRKKDIIQDLAVLTGATVISEELGHKIEDIQLENLGHVKRFVADKDTSTFVDGSGDPEKIKERIVHIQNLIAETESEYEKTQLENRLAKLTGGVAVLKVGAPTEVEMKEVKDRLDDAIHATKAALDGGIVPGGGVAYMNSIKAFKGLKLKNDEIFAIDILKKALKEPMRQILINAGHESPEKVISDCEGLGHNFGYDALNGTQLDDMIKAGIIDPTKVVFEAITNAVSVASQLLATNVVIIDEPEQTQLNQE